MVALNLACGVYYISNLNWVNFDREATFSDVQQLDSQGNTRKGEEEHVYVETRKIINLSTET